MAQRTGYVLPRRAEPPGSKEVALLSMMTSARCRVELEG